MSREQRDKGIECTRALLMLWIVGIWHMQEYVDGPKVNTPYFVTEGVLAAFFFVSGYLLGKKRIESLKDILLFYKRRFIRMYPLFFAAATSYLIMSKVYELGWMTNVRQYLMTIVGLSVFADPAPQTLWFIGMILFFYYWTPFIIYKRALVSNAVFLIIYAVCFLLCREGLADSRVLLYFLPYYFGLVFSNTDIKGWLLKYFAIIGLIVVLYYLKRIPHGGQINSMVFCAAFIPLILFIGSILEQVTIVAKLLHGISYASMVAYLLHRQYCFILVFVFFGMQTWAGVFLVVLPILLILSYGIQAIYDRGVSLVIGGENRHG